MRDKQTLNKENEQGTRNKERQADCASQGNTQRGEDEVGSSNFTSSGADCRLLKSSLGGRTPPMRGMCASSYPIIEAGEGDGEKCSTEGKSCLVGGCFLMQGGWARSCPSKQESVLTHEGYG